MENALEESMRIIEEARAKGVVLRLVGGLAVRQHCSELVFCERNHGDIDLIGLSQQSRAIIEAVEQFGYHENVGITMTTGGTHLLFEKANSEDHVDVFLDKLRMEHEIDLRDRLDIEENTISVSDLLVCKLFIKDLNEKDYRDIITLVKDLPLGHEDVPKTINVDHIAELCSRNWGLNLDLLTAIEACMDFMKTYHLEEGVDQEVRCKFVEIREAMVNHSKSLKWSLRSHIGKRVAWRKEVERENG